MEFFVDDATTTILRTAFDDDFIGHATKNHGIAAAEIGEVIVTWVAFFRGFHFVGDADAAIARAFCASDALTCDVGDGAIFDARAVRANGFGGRAIGIDVALGSRRHRRIVGDARAVRANGFGGRAIGIDVALGDRRHRLIVGDTRAVRANGFGGRAIGIGVALGGRRRRLIVGDARATRTDGLGSRAIGIGEAFGGWGDFASAVGATEGAQFERRSAGVDIAFE